MQFFLGSSKAAVEVRNRFVIKIIPMLNPGDRATRYRHSNIMYRLYVHI
jgi:hypothetical protein